MNASSNHQAEKSVYMWAVLRHRLFRQNGGVPGVASNREKISENHMASYSREESLQYLTLENVRELAIYESPNISEIATPLRGEEKLFPLSPTAPPLTLISASIFVELVIPFSLAYFWFFQHEARRSDTFLAPGTLFGVLNRTKVSRIISYILIFTPCLSVLLLTWWSWWSLDLLSYKSWSKPPSNAIIASLNTISIFLVLWFTTLIVSDFRRR